MISARERYLFDLQGFLVVPGVLSSQEIDACMEAVYANPQSRSEDPEDGSHGSSFLSGGRRGVYSGMLTWPKPHCDIFRELLVHHRMVPYLNAFLGRGWHCDVPPFVHHHTKGTEGLALHLGNPGFSGGSYYVAREGRIRNGLMVVQYTLTDQLEGQGGFCAIPGSHKSNFGRPDEITMMETDREVVVNPEAKAGDAIIFTEAVTHGTWPWTAGHDRYAVHYRFTPKWVQYGPGFHTWVLPGWADELTEKQRSVLEPAGFLDRLLIDDDGTAQRLPQDPEEMQY